jgi:peptidoglycan-associated lipoprotein
MRFEQLGPKLIGVFTALILLAGCESLPQSMGGTGGAGGAAGGGGATATAPVPGRPAAPGSQEDLVVNVGDRVFFDYDKFDLKGPARATLDKQAAWLKQYPQVRLSVEGHCDERGTREYNLALGERRANAAKNYLINQGIAASRLSTISYGKERPVVLGSNESAWAQNRRSVSVVK